MMRAYAYCLDWHLHTSSAFDEILFKPLAPWIEFERIGWDGRQHPRPADPRRLAVYCQYPPPAQAGTPAGVVWVPMWDWLAQSTFNMASLPSGTRVVAFSQDVAQRALVAGLAVHRTQFFLDPERFPSANWNQPRTLLYWNRKGLISTRALAGICEQLHIERLLFRQKLDPVTNPGAALHIGERLGGVAVEHLPAEMTHGDYLTQLARCNLFLAPRTTEGVGLTGLEALSSGCAVLAYDQPALNEYITTGRNGLLLAALSRITLVERLRRTIEWRWAGLLKRRDRIFYFPVNRALQWQGIGNCDPETLGTQARQDHLVGHQAWQAGLEGLARFIIGT